MLVQTRLQARAALLTKSVYGDMKAMGVHLFRGESTGPRTSGPPRSTCPRIGGRGWATSPGGALVGGPTVPPTPALKSKQPLVLVEVYSLY